MVPLAPSENTISSAPAFALACSMAALRDPGPESLVLVTVKVVAHAVLTHKRQQQHCEHRKDTNPKEKRPSSCLRW